MFSKWNFCIINIITSSLSFETNVISEKLALTANKCFLKIKMSKNYVILIEINNEKIIIYVKESFNCVNCMIPAWIRSFSFLI